MHSSQSSLALGRRRQHGLEDRLTEVQLDSSQLPRLHPGFERVLVAVDGTDHDATALAIAGQVVEPGAKLQLVYVRTWRPLPASAHDQTSPTPAGNDRDRSIETAAEATEMVEAAVQAARMHGLEAWGRVVTAPRGGVASAILRAAAAGDAQAIIIVHRSRHGLCTRLHDSVEGELLRSAPCPVLAVPTLRTGGDL